MASLRQLEPPPAVHFVAADVSLGLALAGQWISPSGEDGVFLCRRS